MKKKKNEGRTRDLVARALARCAAGALFLINPNFNLIDIIPDAIGYLLIVSGLRALEPVSPSIAEAKTRFMMLLRISLIRIAALPLTFVVGYNEKTFILIFTLAFALLETIYLLPAFHYLYDGTDYLLLRYGAPGQKKTAPPRIFTGFFIIARAALNVLPELQYLPTQYDENTGLVTGYQRVRLADLEHMLILTNIVFTLAITIIWVIRFRGYIKRLRRNETLTSALGAELRTMTPDEGEALLRTFKLAFTLIGAGVFVSLDFYADGYNLIPDVIPALLLLGVAALFYRRGLCERSLPAVASVYAALTAALAALNYYFASNYYNMSSIGNKVALRWSIAETALSLLCSVVYAVFLFLACRALVRITDRHAGLFAELEFRTKNAKTQRERLRVRNFIWVSFALGFVAEGMSAVYGALRLDYAILWIPSAALTAAFGILTANTLSNLYYQIGLRYGK